MSADIDTILPAVTMQRPRCDCCPPLRVALKGFVLSAGCAAAGFQPARGNGVDYYLHTAHGYAGEVVDYDPRTGLFSPAGYYPVDGGFQPYLSPVQIGNQADLSIPFDEALIESIIEERLAAADAATAGHDPETISPPGNAFYTTQGSGNFVYYDPPATGGEYLASERDDYFNGTVYQLASRQVIHHFRIRVDLPKPHISGSYQIAYRFVTRTTRLTVHVQTFAGGPGGPRGESTITENVDEYSFGNVHTLTLTPAAGATFVQSNEIEWPEPGLGEHISIYGPPGSAGVAFFGGHVGGSVVKTGFIERTHDDSDGPVVGVYLTETASGASRGGTQTWDPTQIGVQEGTPLLVDFTGPLPDGDPQIPDGMASPIWPNGFFGDWPLTSPLPAARTRTSADFVLAGQTTRLHLALSNEFTTDVLRAPVDALIAATDPLIQGDFLCAQHLAVDETWYRRFVGFANFALTLLPEVQTATTYELQTFLDLSDDWTAAFSAHWDQVTIGADGTETVDTHSHPVTFTPALPYVSHPANGEDGATNYLRVDPPDESRVIIRNVRMTPSSDIRICPTVLAYSVAAT